jgi:hypothetical protein
MRNEVADWTRESRCGRGAPKSPESAARYWSRLGEREPTMLLRVLYKNFETAGLSLEKDTRQARRWQEHETEMLRRLAAVHGSSSPFPAAYRATLERQLQIIGRLFGTALR